MYKWLTIQSSGETVSLRGAKRRGNPVITRRSPRCARDDSDEPRALLKGYQKWLTIVLCFSLFSCAQDTPSLQVIETKTMVTRYYDSLGKVLTVTSASDQVLKNVSFPPRYYNPFKVTDMSVNGKRLVDWAKEEGRNFDPHDIQYPLKKGDELRITIDFRPTDPKEDPYKEPNAGDFYEHELLLLFEGERVSQIYFVLRGIAKGTCEDCQPKVSGDLYSFKVTTLTIKSSGAELSEAEKEEQVIPVEEILSLYIDQVAGLIFLKGEDIPRFSIPTVIEGKPTNVTVQGTDSIAQGHYDAGAIFFEDVEVKVANLSPSHTQLTTGAIAIPQDYEGMEAYAVLNFDDVTGAFSTNGSPFDEEVGTLTLVGGIIPIGSDFYQLENGVVGIKFALELINKAEE